PWDMVLAWPFFMCPRTSWTTLRIRSSVTGSIFQISVFKIQITNKTQISNHKQIAKPKFQTFLPAFDRLTLEFVWFLDFAFWIFAFLFLGVKDRFVLHVHRVHDADDGRIHGQFLRLRRQSGAGTLHDQDHLALAGADRVHANERAAGAHELVALAWIDAQRLDGEQLAPGHAGNLLRCHAASVYFRKEHNSFPLQKIPTLPGSDQLFIRRHDP